jgi:hypothetical protein
MGQIQRGESRSYQGGSRKKVVERLADAELFKVGSGSLLATVSLDDSVVRGSLGIDARITESISAVADGWIEKEWNSAKTNFGVMGGVRIKW